MRFWGTNISHFACIDNAVNCPKTGQVTTTSSELPHRQDISNLTPFVFFLNTQIILQTISRGTRAVPTCSDGHEYRNSYSGRSEGAKPLA